MMCVFWIEYSSRVLLGEYKIQTTYFRPYNLSGAEIMYNILQYNLHLTLFFSSTIFPNILTPILNAHLTGTPGSIESVPCKICAKFIHILLSCCRYIHLSIYYPVLLIHLYILERMRSSFKPVKFIFFALEVEA